MMKVHTTQNLNFAQQSGYYQSMPAKESMRMRSLRADQSSFTGRYEKFLNSPKVIKFLKSERLADLLEKADSNGALTNAAFGLVLAGVARPLTIMTIPNGKDKQDNKYASAHGISSAILGFVTTFAVTAPIADMIKNIKKNPAKYMSAKSFQRFFPDARIIYKEGVEGGKKIIDKVLNAKGGNYVISNEPVLAKIGEFTPDDLIKLYPRLASKVNTVTKHLEYVVEDTILATKDGGTLSLNKLRKFLRHRVVNAEGNKIPLHEFLKDTPNARKLLGANGERVFLDDVLSGKVKQLKGANGKPVNVSEILEYRNTKLINANGEAVSPRVLLSEKTKTLQGVNGKQVSVDIIDSRALDIDGNVISDKTLRELFEQHKQELQLINYKKFFPNMATKFENGMEVPVLSEGRFIYQDKILDLDTFVSEVLKGKKNDAGQYINKKGKVLTAETIEAELKKKFGKDIAQSADGKLLKNAQGNYYSETGFALSKNVAENVDGRIAPIRVNSKNGRAIKVCEEGDAIKEDGTPITSTLKKAFSQYQNVDKAMSMAADILIAAPRASLTIALIPPILKHLFGLEKGKKSSVAPATQSNGYMGSTLHFQSRELMTKPVFERFQKGGN